MVGFEKRPKRYPTDLMDEEWLFIQPFLPPVAKRGRKLATDLRDVLDALRYLARTGGGWRMSPNDFLPWQKVYWWFRTPRAPPTVRVVKTDDRAEDGRIAGFRDRYAHRRNGLPALAPSRRGGSAS
jgi:transposase